MPTSKTPKTDAPDVNDSNGGQSSGRGAEREKPCHLLPPPSEADGSVAEKNYYKTAREPSETTEKLWAETIDDPGAVFQ